MNNKPESRGPECPQRQEAPAPFLSSLEGKWLFFALALLLGTQMPSLRAELGIEELSLARFALDGLVAGAYYGLCRGSRRLLWPRGLRENKPRG